MSNFLLEGPGGVPQVKLGGQVNTNKPVNIGVTDGGSSSAILTVGSGGIVNGGPMTFLEPVIAVSGSAATYAPTVAQSSSWYLLNPSTVQQINLPAPVVGVAYTFVVQTAATGSNTLKILTDASTTYMQGTDIIATVGGASTIFQANGSSHRSFNMNGTTTGGLVGTIINLTCLTTTLWQIQAQNFGSGTLATSFATS